jgi:hypothetical protein
MPTFRVEAMRRVVHLHDTSTREAALEKFVFQAKCEAEQVRETDWSTLRITELEREER